MLCVFAHDATTYVPTHQCTAYFVLGVTVLSFSLFKLIINISVSFRTLEFIMCVSGRKEYSAQGEFR
jgi:hypothetical protein